MKKLCKLLRLLLEDVNEDNQKKEVVPDQFKYQSFDEIVIEFHRDNVVSTLVTKILDSLLFIIMLIGLILVFTGLVIQVESTFSVLFSFKIRRAENFFLYYVIAFVIWFLMLYGIIHFRKKHVCKKINVESHEDVMTRREKWMYKKFGTQQLNNYIEQFSIHKDELFVLKDPLSLINNKVIELILLGLITYVVNIVSKDATFFLDNFSLAFIFQVFYMLIICYGLYVLYKLVRLMLALLIDSFTDPNKITNLRKQMFLETLESANRYKVYE